MKSPTNQPILWAALAILLVACALGGAAKFREPFSSNGQEEIAWGAASGTNQASTGFSLDPLDGMATVEALATGTAQAQIQAGTASAESELARAATEASARSDSASTAMTVLLGSETRVDFTFEDIRSLVSFTLEFHGLPREAVSLFVLLERAGWQNDPLLTVTIVGQTYLAFQADQLPGDTALFLENGALNFFSNDIPPTNWPVNVTLIVVE
ncbi:MAG: hypothetical protein AB1750_05015 [Chloroflexota bacterium]